MCTKLNRELHHKKAAHKLAFIMKIFALFAAAVSVATAEDIVLITFDG